MTKSELEQALTDAGAELEQAIADLQTISDDKTELENKLSRAKAELDKAQQTTYNAENKEAARPESPNRSRPTDEYGTPRSSEYLLFNRNRNQELD